MIKDKREVVKEQQEVLVPITISITISISSITIKVLAVLV